MDHGSGSGPRDHIQTVAERKEGVRSDHRSVRVEAKVLGSGDGKLGRIHPAHLTGSNTNHPVFAGQNNSIGFYMLANPPGKVQRPILGEGRSAAGHHLAVLDPHAPKISLLQQQAADHMFPLEAQR